MNHSFRRYIENKSIYFRLFLIATGILIVSILAHWFRLNLLGLESWIKNLGALAPLIYMLLFAIGVPLFLSVDALCLAAGALFPLPEACLYVLISTYLSAAIIFYLGRNLFRDRVTRILNQHPKLQHLSLLIENDLKILFLIRLLPLPFALLSYAFSVTQVRFIPYIISTSAILIYNLALVFLGYGAKHIYGTIHSGTPLYTSHYPLFLVSCLVAIIVFARLLKLTQKKLCLITPEVSEYPPTNDKNEVQ